MIQEMNYYILNFKMGILLVIEYHKEARISIVYMPFFRNHFKIKPTKVWITVIWFRYKKLDKRLTSILFTMLNGSH